MFKLRPIAALALGASLLQACTTPPMLGMQAVLRVHHSSDQTAATYYQLGKYHQEHGNLELAVTAYTHSIALDSRQLEPRNALAAALAGQGRLDEAKSVLLQLVTDYPAVAHPYNNLGYVYFMQGNYSAAVTSLQHALALDAGYERARNNLDAAQAAVASHAGPAAAAPALAAASDMSAGVLVGAAAPLLNPKEENASGPQSAGEQLKAAAPVLQVSVDPALLPLEQAPILPVVHAAAPLLPEQAAAQALAAARSSRLEITNGNGVVGMARRMGRMLGLSGIAVSRITNERPYTRQTTKIQYRLGFHEEAKVLQTALNGHAVMVLTNNLSATSDVQLLLGKDAVGHVALIEGMGKTPLLAMNQATN